MTTKADVIEYFRSASLYDAEIVLEVGAAILGIRIAADTPVPAKKRGRPAGSRSKKAEKPAAASGEAT